MRNLALSLAFCLIQGTLFSATNATSNEFVSRIQSQVVIKDFNAAIQEGKLGLMLFPESSEIREALIHAYSSGGRSQEAVATFHALLNQEELNLKKHFQVLETIAWGVLRDGTLQQQATHMNALISAYKTQDANAIELMTSGMRSTNAYLRAISARLASRYRDKVLGWELLRILREEGNWFVRLEALDAIAAFRLKEAKPVLEKIVASTNAGAEEKMLAIKALVVYYDEFPPEERRKLLKSSRSGFRHLGVELIKRFDQKDALFEVFSLLQDPSLSVRLSALNFLAVVDVKPEEKGVILRKVESLLSDSHPTISLTAGWIMMQYDPTKAAKVFDKWIDTPQPKVRRFAAAVLAKCGFLGSVHLQKHFQESDDPFVKANLALGMLGQKVDVSLASKFLFDFLSTNKQHLSFDDRDNPLFKVLVPSEHRHIPHIPRYPILMDQFTRLEVLNQLTILGYDRSTELIANFLKDGSWGIAGSAAGVLIEEGDLQAIDVVRDLLDSQDQKLTIQAALALAFFGKDKSVVPILIDAFNKVEWDHQLYIIEALGVIGDREAIPFLVKILDKPFQEQRISAASSIIQCLYH